MRRLLTLPYLVLFLAACSPDSEVVNVRLTLEERDRLDNLVTTHMTDLRPFLDSTCSAAFADAVAVATDSIVQRRLEEEARLRARIPQNLGDDR